MTEKNTITIEGKYLNAAFTVAGRDYSRQILTGVHLGVDKSGRWQLEATDSYKAVRIGNGYVGGKNAGWECVLPAEAFENVKDKDIVTFEPDFDANRCRVIVVGKTLKEGIVSLLEGKFPNMDALLVDPFNIPYGCYRYAPTVNAAYLADMAKVATKCFGKTARVEFATIEGEERKPITICAEENDIRLLMLLMPVKHDPKESLLGESNAIGKDAETAAKLRKELEAAKSNADTWKSNCLNAEGKQAELEGQIVELKAKLDESAKVEPQPEAPKAETPKKPEPTKPKAEPKKPTAKKPAAKKPAAKEKPKAAPKKPEKAEPVATAVSLETMTKWCKGKHLEAKQKRDNCPIWVLGNSKEFKDELAAMGFRWGKSKEFGKGWYYRTA